jgi:thioredoxin reductase (NADPH)
MADTEAKIKIFGLRGSPQAYAIREFLYRCDVPFEWMELHHDDQAQLLAHVSGLNDERLPVCIFPDDTRLENPTMRQVGEKLGLFRNPSQSEYDVAIYGAGPAGLSAAVYAASEGLKTVVVERFAVGGQAGASPRIENYLGFPEGVSGAQLTERAYKQASHFGADILMLREGVRGEFPPGKGIGYLDDGTKIVARASICSTGVDYRKLGLANEDRLRGAGVYYGAGASEASLCSLGEHVFVVGGGNSAAQAVLHFARYTGKVTLVVRGRALRETVSQYLVDRIQSCPEILVLLCTEVAALHGDEMIRAVTLRNNDTGKEWQEETNWLFLCLGGTPRTQWAEEVGIIRDEGGYLITGPNLLKNGRPPSCWTLDRLPYYMETNLPGVFAAGDVRHGSVKRCAAAVGEGAMAVTFVHRYIAGG